MLSAHWKTKLMIYIQVWGRRDMISSSIVRQTNRGSIHIHVLVNSGLSGKGRIRVTFSTDFKANKENELWKVFHKHTLR